MTAKKSLYKNDRLILDIIGNNSVSYDKINCFLLQVDVRPSCLGGLLDRMVKTGLLDIFFSEDGCVLYKKGKMSSFYRKCLGCGNMFESEGKHNRQCKNCQNRQEY